MVRSPQIKLSFFCGLAAKCNQIMNWVLISIFAYFINAFSSVIDKFILKKPIQHPIVLGFYSGILSIFVLFLAPFGLNWPGFSQFLISILAGIIFLAALIVFYSVLREGETSRIIPVIGGFTPIFVLIISYFVLGAHLTLFQFIAFGLLVCGGVLISAEKNDKNYKFGHFKKSIFAAFLFAIFYILSKYIFLNQPFISGFIWQRLGSFLGAIFLLVIFKNRELIFKTSKELKFKWGALVVVNKIIGGISFILINYAIYLGSVALVSALEGTRYAFIFLIVTALSIKYPAIFEEKISTPAIIQKIIAILLISLGFVVLFIKL